MISGNSDTKRNIDTTVIMNTTETINPAHLLPDQMDMIIELHKDFTSQTENENKAAKFKASGKFFKNRYHIIMPSRHQLQVLISQTIEFTRPVIIMPTIDVNPAKLTAATKRVLKFMLHQYQHQPILNVLNPISKQPNLFVVAIPDPASKRTVKLQIVRLTHSLIRFPSKKDGHEFRYAVCNKKPLGEGGLGYTFISRRTLRYIGESEGCLDIECFVKENPSKWRVVKQLYLPTNANREVMRIGTSPKLDRSEQNEMIRKEANFLRKISFFHVKAPILSADNSSPALIMRCAEGRELYEYLYDDINGIRVLTVDQRINLTILIIEAIINQVHDNGLIHRDIKPENIIVKENRDNQPEAVTIIDFGLAREKRDKYNVLIGGTIDYLAPEIMHGIVANEKSDCYSFVSIMRQALWANMSHGKYHDLQPEHKVKILAAMISGSENDMEGRASLQDILDVFVSIKSDRTNEILNLLLK